MKSLTTPYLSMRRGSSAAHVLENEYGRELGAQERIVRGWWPQDILLQIGGCLRATRVIAALVCTPLVLIVLDMGFAVAHGWRPVLRMEFLAMAVLAVAAVGCALPVVLPRSATV